MRCDTRSRSIRFACLPIGQTDRIDIKSLVICARTHNEHNEFICRCFVCHRVPLAVHVSLCVWVFHMYLLFDSLALISNSMKRSWITQSPSTSQSMNHYYCTIQFCFLSLSLFLSRCTVCILFIAPKLGWNTHKTKTCIIIESAIAGAFNLMD